MEFLFRCLNGIPKLAWCMILRKGAPTATVFHGEWVATGEDFFVEGVWNARFEEKGFHLSHAFMGSGAVIDEECLIISAPSHTIECVYTLAQDNNLFVSNSIPFILQASNDDLDPSYLDYESDILSISDGIYHYTESIPTKNSTLNLHYFCNLRVDSQLTVQKQPKPAAPRFNNYNQYHSFLVDALKEISANASSKIRKKNYEPIVFCSTGYDSSACAALGREINCNDAVVYESKRGTRTDSGKEIVKSLGYETIIEKHEMDYMQTDFAEEFVSSGELGTSIFFASAEKELPGKFVLSGIHGDKVWDKETKYLTDELKRSFYPDTARKEFRLRVGFFFVTIPFFAAQSVKDIYAISNSNEMKPWTLGNDYDRPIPRRILEEKGIPREMFGFHKDGGAGSSLRFLNLRYLKRVMPSKSFADFKIYYQQNRKRRRFKVKIIIRHFVYTLYCLNIFLQAKGIKVHSTSKWNRKYLCSPWAPSFLFNWGVQKVKTRYQQIVDNARSMKV